MLGRMFSIDSVAGWWRVRLLFAVARLYFGQWITNLQTSWVKFGPQLAAELFHWGANNVCGTLFSEKSGGAERKEPQISIQELQELIIGAGRIPAQRATLHELVGERL